MNVFKLYLLYTILSVHQGTLNRCSIAMTIFNICFRGSGMCSILDKTHKFIPHYESYCNSHLSLNNPTPTHCVSTLNPATVLYYYIIIYWILHLFINYLNSVTGVSFLIACLKAAVRETLWDNGLLIQNATYTARDIWT